MRFKPCDCRAEHYGRVQRSLWMRLVPSRRLYHCLGCDQLLFIRPEDAGGLFPDTVPAQASKPEEREGQSA